MANKGSTLVSCGANPGSDVAKTTVTGLTGILDTAQVEATKRIADAGDYLTDEMLVLDIDVYAANPNAAAASLDIYVVDRGYDGVIGDVPVWYVWQN